MFFTQEFEFDDTFKQVSMTLRSEIYIHLIDIIDRMNSHTHDCSSFIILLVMYKMVL